MKHPHNLSSAAMAHLNELLDEALKQTFPASDPIAINIELTSIEHRAHGSESIGSRGEAQKASKLI
jgi:hypothetical protein